MAEVFWHNLEVKEIGRILRTNIEKGLSEQEVKIRQREFGKNKLPEEKPASKLKIFYSQFKSPLIYILLAAGAITFILRDFADTAVIFGAGFLNALFGFFQENKTSQTLRALKKIVRHTAKVLREGSLKVIDSEEVVPGDIVLLSAGDKVPADGRVFKADVLKINEMALTGEWLASEKSAGVLPENTILADRDNMVYMGTVVEEGWGRAIVTETGIQTEIGKIAEMIKEAKEERTPYQKKLADFSRIIGLVISLISFFIFVVGLATGKGFVEMFTLTVAVAVAAIPEGLPVAMTVILALGVQRILERKGLVRKLASAETLGSATIIVTDKTGTLTEGKMKVEKIIPARPGGEHLTLKAGILTSEAFVENPGDKKEEWRIRGRPTERALLEAGIEFGINGKREFENKKTAEMPFNSVNKFAAALYEEADGKFIYICGAPEKILERCDLNKRQKENLEEKLGKLTSGGLRVLASAYKKVDRSEKPLLDFCKNLIFLGFVTLKDAVRADVKEAVKICRNAGMKPIIVTGDHKATAIRVAEEIGLKIKNEDVLEGAELDNIAYEAFQKILPKIQIYARVEPRHKLKIIEAWQKRGEVVAMTGDGVNDAPALKRADIGVALGSGTEVAKETSDLILLNDSFSIIVAAVEEGRAIIDNIRKVITYLLSDSFTEIILIGGTMLISWLTNTPWLLPVAATQILWVNLIEDGPLSLALAFEQKENDLMARRPETRSFGGTPLLTKEMKFLIFIIGLITDFFLLGMFLWLSKYSDYEISHIRTLMFAGLTIDSIFFVFSCRSLRKNIWKINPFSNKFLTASWIFGVTMLLGAIYLPPLQMLLKTQSLNFFDWQLILGLGFLNIILIEATKWYFIAKARKI